MRKPAAIIIIAAVLVLASCATVVPIGYMQPSAIDMGGYRNLAVASAVPYGGPVPGYRFVGYADVHAAGLRIYSGYVSSTAQRIADYATSELYSTLSASGFYNLLPPDMTDAVLDADALLLLTEWKCFRMPSWGVIKREMKEPLVIDGRNIYDITEMEEAGFKYYSIGR